MSSYYRTTLNVQSVVVPVETAFRIEVDTSISGTGTVSNTDQFQFTGAVGDYDVEAIQNDVVVQTYTALSGQQTITLPSSGVYDLRVIPVGGTPFSRINFNSTGDRRKVKRIRAWGSSVVWSSFERAFFGCTNITSVDGGLTNTGSVTNMSRTFQSCSMLTSIDISSWNTANVTNMFVMFIDCISLTSLDLSNFNTANVTNMNGMFSGCSSLTSLDLSGFDTEKVTNMTGMFGNCSMLTSIDLSNFNTANVTTMASMFLTCSSLTSLDVSNFNTIKVTTMASMFQSCASGQIVGAEDFNIIALTTASNMFLSTTLSTPTYDALLVNWEAQTKNNNVAFHGGGSKYSSGAPATARQNLITNTNWTITDGGEV
jgi:surface protein